MKNTLLATLFILLSLGMNAQVINEDDRDNLRNSLNLNSKYCKHIADNHITSTKVVAYSKKNPNGVLHSEYKYDSHGNVLENIQYNKRGRVKLGFRFQYDDNNREILSVAFTKSGKAQWGGFWTYDKSGNTIETRNWWKDTTDVTYSCVITYDAKNNPMQTKIYYNKKKLYSTSVYEYYDDGSKKKTTTYDHKGKVIGVWNYDCNPIGKLQESKMKDTSKVCVHYETDKNGNPVKVKEEYTEDDGLFKRRLRDIRKYDKDGHLIEYIVTKMNGKETWHACADFNSQGNETEWRHYVPNTTIIKKRSVYTYNNSGDIIEATIYSKSKPLGAIQKYVYN